jgi:transcriptional regulator with XRE-family HTH domain
MAQSKSNGWPTRYGRGTGIADPTDVRVGKCIRARRLFLDMSQAELATALGLTFQQVQKYEKGRNRVSASRLAKMAEIFDVPVSYFFSGLPTADASLGSEDRRWQEMMEKPETIDLIRFYYAIPDDTVRKQVLGIVKAVAEVSNALRTHSHSCELPRGRGVAI